MDIPFVDLKAQYQRLKPDIDARIHAVLDHGKFIMGPEVAELELALAEFAGTKHAIAVSSGSDALLVALMAYGIGPGQAVFLPSFTFTATAEVVLLTGATPVFVDVEQDSFNIDIADLEAKIAALDTDRLKPAAVIPVDLFGLPADYGAITAVANRSDMAVIGDAAQSFGGRWRDCSVGALADMTCTSFFPAKPLGGYGDGGAIFTDDDDLAEVTRSIRVHGTGEKKYEIVRLGLNARLDTLQAAILLPKLAVFADEVEKRVALAGRYNAALNGIVKTPTMPNHARSAWAQYTIQLDNRDAVAAALKEKGVPTAIYYPNPMHLQTAYREYGDGPGSLPICEELSGSVLSLPMHAYMAEDTAKYICDSVVAAVEASKQ
jgi:UDP-2-acetamido-2-deoxy-ribo-hexuluronate aminotransferase